MRVNVVFSPLMVDELFFTHKTVAVIDVLRATSTITTALANGAREVFPVGSMDMGSKVFSSFTGGKSLRGGEKNMKRIDGFNLGNSPLEYTHEIVNDKSVILFTTNGTKSIVKTKFAANVYIGSFLNISAVVNQLITLDGDIEILCSGNHGSFSLEDALCAGKMVSMLVEKVSEIEITDAASAAVVLSKNLGKNIKKTIMQCDHGKLLIENGFEDDLVHCSKIDWSNELPYYKSNVIKLMRSEEQVKPISGIATEDGKEH